MNEERTKQIADIEQQMVRIRAQCHGWLKCQDGSYEMALHYAGYDQLAAQLKQLKEVEE